MSDITLERQTYILVTSRERFMFPANDLYPSDDLYPAEMERVYNIVSGTMQINEIMCDKELAFGQLYATKFEVQVYDTEDLSGKYIIVVQEENNVSQIVFSGIIDSCKQDRLGYDRTIVAYDLAYSKSYTNVADWWTSFWENHETATLKQLRESLLDYTNISYEDVELINDDVVFSKSATVSSMPFGTMLKMICELSCCFPHFTRKGFMEFIVLNDEEFKELSEDDYEGESSTFQEYVTTAITGVQFYSSSGNIVHTEGTTDNPYSITQNLLTYSLNENDMTTVGNNMLDYISTLQYTPVSISMIIGSFDYKLGDYIKTEHGNFYLFKNDYSGAQFVEENLTASGSETREVVGTDFDVPEAVITEVVEEVVDAVDDAYELADDLVTNSDSTYSETEELKKNIEDGDGYVLSVISSTTGQEVWDTTGYYFTEENSGYSAPEAVREQEPVWSNQGYDIAEETYGKPVRSYTTDEDIGNFYLDVETGDIYELKNYSSVAYAKSGVTQKKVRSFHKIASGVVDHYEYEWSITPELAVGAFYLDSEAGKIYKLEQGEDAQGQPTYSWTLIKQCQKVSAQLETRIDQTAEAIELEAAQRLSDDNELSSRITVNANSIESEVSARSGADIQLQSNINQLPHEITMGVSSSTISANTGASITVTLKDANGNIVDSDSSGYIYLDGNVVFKNQLYDGTTTISGDNIKTGTIGCSMISADGDLNLDFSNLANNSFNIITVMGGTSSLTSGLSTSTQMQGLRISPNVLTSGISCDSIKFGGSTNSYWENGDLHCNRLTVHNPESNTRAANMYISTGGWVYRVDSGSSMRWKNNITTELINELDPKKLYDIDVVQFKYNTDYLDNQLDRRYDTPLVGFIAEDVADKYPIACDFDDYGMPSGWNAHYMIPPMLALIQEQNKRIEVLENKLNELQGGN